MTKGEWKVSDKYIVIKENPVFDVPIGGILNGDEEDLAIMTLAGNLNQKYELSELQELAKTVNKVIGELAQFGRTVSPETFESLKVSYHKLIAPVLKKAEATK